MKQPPREYPLGPLLVAVLAFFASSCGDGAHVSNDPCDFGACVEDVDPNWDQEAADFENEVLVLVNQRRARGANCGGTQRAPTHPLNSHPLLRHAARLHSLDMYERDYFSHTNPDGDGPGARITAVGYDGRGGGENIARGQRTPEAVVEAWMNSSGHCNNIMNSNYEEIGIGYHERHWTQKFSRPR